MIVRPRILHLRASRFVGGPEKQLLDYAKRELHGPYEIILGSFLAPDEGHDFYQAARHCNLSAVVFPDDLWGRNSALLQLKHFLRTERISLLCTHGYKADILGLLAGRSARVPVVPFLRGWTGEDWKVALYEALDRRAIMRADRIVTLSALHAENLAKETGLGGKVHTVVNAIDCSPLDLEHAREARAELLQRFQLPPQSFLIVCAGRLSREKGTTDLLRAASLLKDRHEDIRWIIFGDGVLRESLQNLAHDIRIGDRVVFAGFEGDLQNILPGCDLLVNPSLAEQMPNIVLEGMAAGIPVLATDVGGVREIAGPMMALALVAPARPDELARCISDLKTDRSRTQALALAGYRRVTTAFSRESQIQAFHELYEDVIPAASKAALPIGAPVHAGENRLANELADPAPFLSVVIPVRNEETHIASVLESLLIQNYPRDRYEILVVDGMSTDHTRQIVEDYANRSQVLIRCLPNPLGLSSAGRNQGIRNSRGSYVLFIDGHAHLPSNDLLRDSASLFQSTSADCLCRPQPLDFPANSIFQQAVAAVRSTVIGHGRDSTIYDLSHEGFIPPMSSGASYRRAVFEKVGLFDETFDACEDVEFNFRVHQAGFCSYSSPRLHLKYRPRTNLGQLWRQMERYGTGRFRLACKHPQAAGFFQLIPVLLILWIVFGLLLSWAFPVVRWTYIASLALYFGVVLLSSLGIAMRKGLRVGLWVPPICVVVHFGLGMGFLKAVLGSLSFTANASRRDSVTEPSQRLRCPESAARNRSQTQAHER
jgi:glycosyltransferase involved in cell wall biosynthesis